MLSDIQFVPQASAPDAKDLVSKGLHLIISHMNHSNTLVQTSALASLVEISRFLSLPIPDGEFPESKPALEYKPLKMQDQVLTGALIRPTDRPFLETIYF